MRLLLLALAATAGLALRPTAHLPAAVHQLRTTGRSLDQLLHLRGGDDEDEPITGDEEQEPVAEPEDAVDEEQEGQPVRQAAAGSDELVRDVVEELELEEELEAAGSRLVVVDFYAEWCKPCKMIAPVIEELARKAKGKVVFLKVDVDEARELAGFQGVKSMPTIHFFRNGKRVDTIVGANVPALREKVGRAMAPALLRSLTAERVLIPGLAAYLLLPRLFKDKASIPFWQMFLAS